MKSGLRITAVLFVVACLMLVAAPHSASAHPMGNFTINQYSALTIRNVRSTQCWAVRIQNHPRRSPLG